MTIPPAVADPIERIVASLPPTELLRIASLAEASRLSGEAEDSLRRHYAEYIVRLSPRRVGMRVVHALMLNST